MSATVVPFRPPWAVTAWVDERNVYIEMPGPMPFVQRYPLTEAGLSKALNIFRARHRAHASPAQPAPSQPATRFVHRGRATRDAFTDAQRDRARAVLNRLGGLKKKPRYNV